MELSTASQVISLARQLEENGAGFYEELAQRQGADKETWLSLAKENKRNIVQVERAYYGVISDALEGCFTFKMNTDDYLVDVKLTANASYASTLQKAVEMEDKTIKFYSDAAEQSRSLLADVPRAFKAIALKRAERKNQLQSLSSGKR